MPSGTSQRLSLRTGRPKTANGTHSPGKALGCVLRCCSAVDFEQLDAQHAAHCAAAAPRRSWRRKAGLGQLRVELISKRSCISNEIVGMFRLLFKLWVWSLVQPAKQACLHVFDLSKPPYYSTLWVEFASVEVSFAGG